MLHIKQHDTAPPVQITVTEWGKRVDLTRAAQIRLLGTLNGVLVLDRLVTGDAAGVIKYDWQAGETDVTGRMQIEVEVTWLDGHVQTFPPRGYLPVEIEADLA